MKKFTAFAAAAVSAAVCFTSCSVPVKNSSSRRNGLASAFSADAVITIEKLTAEGVVQRTGKGEWDIEFSAPNTLSGVKLGFSDGSVTASYKGLSFSVPQSAVPVKSMMLNLIKAVDEKAELSELKGEEKDDMLRLSGELEGGSYVLSVDKDGLLSGFEMPNNHLKMNFTNIRVSGSTSPAEEVTADFRTTEKCTETTGAQ